MHGISIPRMSLCYEGSACSDTAYSFVLHPVTGSDKYEPVLGRRPHGEVVT
jgi:hypothetical protein